MKRHIILFILLTISVNAISINLEEQWKTGSEHYIEISSELKELNITLEFYDLNNDLIDIDYTEKYVNDTFIYNYKIPQNFNKDVLKLKIKLNANTDYYETEKIIYVEQLPRWKKFFNWIFGNLFNWLPFS